MTTLREWADDLRRAGAEVMDEGEKVVSKGSLNVKDDWRARWSGHERIKHVPGAIGYDVERSEDRVESTIGPDKEQIQAAIANIIEFGSVNNAPIPGGAPALDAEEPRFVRAAADLGEMLLDER